MHSLIFHANLQYAEIPKKEIERVINKSYKPTIATLLKEDIPFALNITGFSIQYLPKELIRGIKDGIESNLIEITGTSYSHAILPLLSLNRVKEQIEMDVRMKEDTLEVKPISFWPPELAYDPILPAILKDLNFEYVFVDGEALLFSNYMNTAIKNFEIPYIKLIKASYGQRKYLNYFLGLRQLRRSLSYVFGGKALVKGVKNIVGIPVWQPVNITLMLSLGHFPFMNERKAARWLSSIRDIMLYGTDIEFFGYMPFAGKKIKISTLIKFIKSNNINITLPSQLPMSGREFYLKTSSWAPDKSLRIWKEDEDNRRLNMLISGIKGDNAFMAENSDARGWEPLPERRLDAFKAIYEEWRKEYE